MTSDKYQDDFFKHFTLKDNIPTNAWPECLNCHYANEGLNIVFEWFVYGFEPLSDFEKEKMVQRATTAVHMFIKAGANVNFNSKYSFATPLNKAATYGLSDICNILIESGSDLNARNKMGATPLHSISSTSTDYEQITYNAQATIESLINAGSDVNALDSDGFSPLDYAYDNLSCINNVSEMTLSQKDEFSQTAKTHKTISLLIRAGARTYYHNCYK